MSTYSGKSIYNEENPESLLINLQLEKINKYLGLAKIIDFLILKALVISLV